MEKRERELPLQQKTKARQGILLRQAARSAYSYV